MKIVTVRPRNTQTHRKQRINFVLKPIDTIGCNERLRQKYVLLFNFLKCRSASGVFSHVFVNWPESNLACVECQWVNFTERNCKRKGRGRWNNKQKWVLVYLSFPSFWPPCTLLQSSSCTTKDWECLLQSSCLHTNCCFCVYNTWKLFLVFFLQYFVNYD